jgi:hypothetical protein
VLISDFIVPDLLKRDARLSISIACSQRGPSRELISAIFNFHFQVFSPRREARFSISIAYGQYFSNRDFSL